VKRYLVLLVLLACSNKKDDAPPPKAEKTAEAPKPKQPVTAALFGKTVTPPGPLAKLQFGMNDKDAQKQLEAANEANTLEGVHWWLGLPRKAGKLDDVLVEFPTAQRGTVAEAWGAGQDADRGGHPVTVWLNPDAGVRAELSDDNGHSTLRFEPYTPVVKIFGDGPQIAALSKPFVGMSQADLAKAYPELVDEGGHLWLPQTEWEFGSGTPVSPYPMEGPIESLAFSIPFNKKDPKTKDAILAVIEKKWGKVKRTETLGMKSYVYNEASPHIEVEENDYEKNGVNVRVSEAKAKKQK
jgi:hypothetical protein